MFQHDAAITNLRHQIQVMAHHDQGLASRAQLLNLRDAQEPVLQKTQGSSIAYQ